MNTDTTTEKQQGSKVGIVTSAKCDKTRKVQVNFLAKHPKYGKYLRRRTVLQVHDENNQARLGDEVEIVPCRPMSKTKRWAIARVIKQAP